jgi:transcriptional regulator with XRE-family HTH domain
MLAFLDTAMPASKRPRSNHEDKLMGRRVRLRRRQMKMTQAELGVALNPRRSLQQIQKFESGKNRLLATTVLQLSVALQIPVTDLLGTVALNAPARSLDSRAYDLVAQLERLRPEVRKALLKLTRALAKEGR